MSLFVSVFKTMADLKQSSFSFLLSIANSTAGCNAENVKNTLGTK